MRNAQPKPKFLLGFPDHGGPARRVLQANRRFYELFQLPETEEEGRRLFDLEEGPFDVSEFRELLNAVLTEGKSFEDYRLEHKFPRIGLKRLNLDARLLKAEETEEPKILLAIQDVTDGDPCFKTDSAQKGNT